MTAYKNIGWTNTSFEKSKLLVSIYREEDKEE